MKSHELARKLLALPDLPVATFANNHTNAGDDNVKIGLLKHYAGDHIVIGNMWRKDINGPNWYISEMLKGEAQ